LLRAEIDDAGVVSSKPVAEPSPELAPVTIALPFMFHELPSPKPLETLSAMSS